MPRILAEMVEQIFCLVTDYHKLANVHSPPLSTLLHWKWEGFFSSQEKNSIIQEHNMLHRLLLQMLENCFSVQKLFVITGSVLQYCKWVIWGTKFKAAVSLRIVQKPWTASPFLNFVPWALYSPSIVLILTKTLGFAGHMFS
jgi:hypothetical protein